MTELRELLWRLKERIQGYPSACQYLKSHPTTFDSDDSFKPYKQEFIANEDPIREFERNFKAFIKADKVFKMNIAELTRRLYRRSERSADPSKRAFLGKAVAVGAVASTAAVAGVSTAAALYAPRTEAQGTAHASTMPDKDMIDRILQEGNRLILQGQYDQGVAKYDEAIRLGASETTPAQLVGEISPDARQVYSEATRQHRKAGRGEIPHTVVDKYLEAYQMDGNVLSLFQAAQAYRGMGNNAQAIESLNKVIELAPTFAQGHGALGNVYREKGDCNRAVAEYEIFLKLNTNPKYTERIQQRIQECKAIALNG